MSTEILPKNYALSEEDIKALEAAGILPAKTPIAQIKIFAQVCQDKRLSPFSKHIYLMAVESRDKSKITYTTVTGINGYRILAQRAGFYAGSDNPIFNLRSDGSFNTLAEIVKIKENTKQNPVSCTVTVYKIVAGHRVPFTATVAFSEFYRPFGQWLTMPLHMICIKAEAHALLKAFSEETSGLALAEDVEAQEHEPLNIKPKGEINKQQKPKEDKPEVTVITEEDAKQYDELKTILDTIGTEKEVRQFYKDNAEDCAYDGNKVIAAIFANRVKAIRENGSKI